jgi:hypothetical protein
MTRRNRTGTVRLLVSLDTSTDGILEDLACAGIFGKNKAEVALKIIREWIWSNEEKLTRHGIKLFKRKS